MNFIQRMPLSLTFFSPSASSFCSSATFSKLETEGKKTKEDNKEKNPSGVLIMKSIEEQLKGNERKTKEIYFYLGAIIMVFNGISPRQCSHSVYLSIVNSTVYTWWKATRIELFLENVMKLLEWRKRDLRS